VMICSQMITLLRRHLMQKILLIISPQVIMSSEDSIDHISETSFEDSVDHVSETLFEDSIDHVSETSFGDSDKTNCSLEDDHH